MCAHRALLLLFAVLLPFHAPAQDVDEPALAAQQSGHAALRSLLDEVFQQNPAFLAQQLRPLISAEFEQVEAAAFDPVIEAQVAYAEDAEERLARTGAGREFEASDSFVAGLSASKLFSSGTVISTGVRAEQDQSSLYNAGLNTVRIGIGVEQPLLQGFGPGYNLLRLRQQQIGTALSWFELKGYALAIALEVEETFWRHLLAGEELRVLERSITLNEQRLADTRERVRLGAAAQLDLPAVEADVARARELLIRARAEREKTDLALERLKAGASTVEVPDLDTFLQGIPEVGELQLSLSRAMNLRPDLAQARFEIESSRLDIRRTRNGLMPRLDLFANLGMSGYGSGYRESASNVSRDTYDLEVGAAFSYPWGNRAAEAQNRAAAFSLKEAILAFENYRSIVVESVSRAWVDARAAIEAVASTRTTLEFAQAAFNAEQARFEQGLSTAFQVSQAQQNLLDAELNVARARVQVRLDFAQLYAAEGSLLERRGIVISGFPEHLLAPRNAQTSVVP